MLEVAWERAQKSDRPLARDRERFAQLHAARQPLYESVAGLVLADGAEKTPAFVDALRRGSGGPRMVWSAQGYPVWVGAGVLDAAADLLPDEGRCFVIADEHVQQIHGERLAGLAAATLTVPSGEQHKTIAQAERLLRELAGAGMQRSDTIVALGGGVVGDLAGFCAATYQRGVAIAHVPTTVVAQVDSAYGGKTGVDLPEGKNYVGAFHQPAAVLTDPSVLGTLPPQELAAGFAEIVKTALIAGGGLWEEVRGLPPLRAVVESDPATMTRVIEACARTKLSIVARGRARHRLPGRAEPRAHVCACARVGHRLRAVAPRRRGRARPARRPAGLGAGHRARPRGARGRRPAAGDPGPAEDLRGPAGGRAARPHEP